MLLVYSVKSLSKVFMAVWVGACLKFYFCVLINTQQQAAAAASCFASVSPLIVIFLMLLLIILQRAHMQAALARSLLP